MTSSTNFQQLPIEVLDSRIWPIPEYTLSRLRKEAADRLATLFPAESPLNSDTLFKMLERARNEEHGLFALPCPQLKLPGNPVSVAQDLAARFPRDELFTNAVAAGPFLNISVDGMRLLKDTIKETLTGGEAYGTNNIGEGKRLCIDYSSPNIAKPFHVGHLRSTIIGNFLKLVYRANGFHVHGINYLGDWGKQYGLLAVGFARYGSEEALQNDPIRHLFDVYVKINADAKDDESIDDAARAYFKKMEEGDEEALKLWRRFRELSIEKYKQIYSRLNVEFEEYSGESCFEAGMMDRVAELEKMGLLIDSQGAKVVDLEPYKLGKAIIIKKDGATLYLTRDIAAANERFERLRLDKAIYVIASQQDLHMQQLFKIMELSGRPWASNMVHINFGMVLGMSTRRGKVEFLEDVLNDAKNTMHEVMKENPAKYAEIADPEGTSDILAISAIVVQDMAARRVKDYKWEIERVTKFEGDTGPYLQYAHSRLRSIERKAAEQFAFTEEFLLSQADLSLLNEKEALSLALLVARYPDVVQEARITTEPCTVINYLMLLSRAISTTLDRLWVLNQDADLARARVALYTAARITLGNGLRLIGLKPLDLEKSIATSKLSKSRSAGYLRRASTAFDVAPFTVTNFSPSEYLKAAMPIDTDDAIHTIHRSLQNSHECTVAELGKSFYKNYAEFVKVAQEADRFETDLNTVRAMISQLKSFSVEITGNQEGFEQAAAAAQDEEEETEPSPALSIREPLQGNTSEVVKSAPIVVDSETRAKLKKISDLLPEASKHVQDAREVIFESVNMAVYLEKQWKPAQVWLLSNGCLVASRKAKVSLTQGVRHKLTFERFYTFTPALQISNVKNTADLQNCFKIKNSENGSVFLHCDDEATKNKMIDLIQKALQDQERELQQQQMLEQSSASQTSPNKFIKQFRNEQATRTHRRTSSACTTGTVSRPSLYDSIFDNQELSPDVANNFEKTIEDLSEALSCTNYTFAVDLVEKLNYDFGKINFSSPLVVDLKSKFMELRNQLSSFLFMEMSDSLVSKAKMVEHVQRLIVLGFTEDARERFFISRSELIKSMALKIQYFGNVFASVALLSSITFESIETAFDWFNESFLNDKLMPAFVSWSRNEISRFCEIFSRQALRRDLSMEVVAECIQDALNKCKNLSQCGLDLSMFLEERLGQTLKNALKSRAAVYLLRVEEALSKDAFETSIAFDRPDWPKNLLPQEDRFRATESSVQLVQSIDLYLNDVLPLLKTPQLIGFCVASVYDFIDNFSDKFIQAFYAPGRSNTQLCLIAANVEVISRALIPNLIEKFAGSDAILVDLKNRLISSSEALYSIIADILAKSIVPTDFVEYSKISSFSAANSDWIKAGVPILAKLSRDSAKSHRKTLINQTISKIASIFRFAIENEVIKFPNEASIHRLVLDLNLLLHVATEMIDSETKNAVENVIDAAIKTISSDLDRPLPSSNQIQTEIEDLVKIFEDFTIDFKK